MIATATVRMVRAALEHETTGVEAQLDILTRDGDDPRPEAIAAFLDVTRDDPAVTQKNIPEWPILVVAAEMPTVGKAASISGTVFDVPSFTVTVAYAVRQTAEAAQAWRDADYVMRACWEAFARGLFASSTAAARTRGSIAIVKCNEMTYGPINHDVSGGKVVGALLLNLHIRDTRP